MPEAEIISWLQSWYEGLCDGNREHQYGIKIETLDNPGWHVTIELRLSPYSNMTGRELESDLSESDWFICLIRDQKFEGFGDPKKLSFILQTFREWIEKT